jgi:putative hydrolase
MTRPPFGFGPGDQPEEPSGGDDPFGLSAMFGGAGGPFGGDMGAVFAQMQRLMSWSGGPVNWDLATEVATGATRADDRPVTSAQEREIGDACRLADLWLDPVTTLPASGAPPQAWTRTGWVESTLPAWRSLVDPVAGRVVAAMGTALEQGLAGGSLGEGLPPEVAGMLGGLGGGGLGGAGGGLGPLRGVMDQVGGFVFGAQVGQALGALAQEVLSSSEIGLPLSNPGRPALLPGNLAAFSEGLEVPADEVRLYVCLRELAHQRLFASVSWLKAHLFDAVDAYARGIEVDPSAIERAVGSIDPSDPESMQRAMGEGLFDLEPTPAQQAALARLETALALVEGWVDQVVDAACAGTLPSAAALRETVRRRRASGGPAEQTFATLVGLQLRPRRLREAAALWTAVAEAGGTAARDALWAHPDLLPSAEDLDDPAGFVARSAGSATDWDAGLRDLDKDLDGTLDDDAAGGPAGEDDGPDDARPDDDRPADDRPDDDRPAGSAG